MPFALLIIVLGSTAGAATVQVQVGDGPTFSPQNVYIHPGDTVEWIWRGELSHSVTSTYLLNPGLYRAYFGIPVSVFNSGIHSAPFSFSVSFPKGPARLIYQCTVHGESGTVYVTELETGLLFNISTRASVQTGDRVTIAGFVVSGTDPKPVLIRGLGPTLGTFNVSGSLQDPTLELHDATTSIMTNDDWQQAANAGQIPVGFRPTDPRESAILATLQPGNYTAIMAGKNGTTGIGLVEVYDMNTATNTATLSQLTNVSTRGFVGTGDSVLIGGFIATAGNTRVVVRALGPTLAQSPFNVPGALADPSLVLKDANGVTIAENDNWKDNGQQSAIEVYGRGLAPTNDFESAIVTLLAPGKYTALVSGVGEGTGIALVEVYNIP